MVDFKQLLGDSGSIVQWKESNESEIVIKMSMAELKMQDGRNLLNTWTEKIESVRGMKRNEVQTWKNSSGQWW